MWFICPYLGREVELTPERVAHIRRAHPELLPSRMEELRAALADPDEVRARSWRPSQLPFVRHGERDDFVVVVTSNDEPVNDADPPRAWVVTAYASADPPLSEVVWSKP